MTLYTGKKPQAPFAANIGHAVAWNGVDIYSDTSVHTGSWTSFVVLQDTIISAITDNGSNASTIPTATELPAGTFISANGLFSSIQLTSGMLEMVRE